jgi:histidine triad (HIT) family protein
MSATVADCLFCKIVAGEIPATVVAQTETTFAFRDINPQAPTHVLVVPRAHYPEAVSLAKAEPSLLADVFTAAGEIAEAEGVAESGYRMLFNTGADAGQTVFHAHLHLLGGRPLGHLLGRSLNE